MTLKEIPRNLYTIFNFIDEFDKAIRENRTEKLNISKTDKKLLKKIYNVNEVWRIMLFNDFKNATINIAIHNKQDIIWAANQTINIIESDLYKKTK